MGRARIAIEETGRESTMRISAFCTAVFADVVIGHAPPMAAQVDQQRAQEYFKEARRSAATKAPAGATTKPCASSRECELKKSIE